MDDEKKKPRLTDQAAAATGDDAGGAREAGDGTAPESAGAAGGPEGMSEPCDSDSPAEESLRKTPDERERARKQAKAAAGDIERFEAELSRLSEEAEGLRSEARDLKDKWLRSVAEFDNFRKRTRKEWDLLQQRTTADVMLNVLSVVDDFERAFSVVGDKDDDFTRGIRLIYNKLASTIEEVGVRKIQALGAAFDPTYHMAVAQIEREGAESNSVVEVVQDGYSLGDVVIRPAKVVLAK
ncbi:MAG: grpE [Candidatus Krumholzibacteriota bacterium]|nr:grpE [Candidatus Krumholzibacteriota bacterium]